MKRRIKVKTSKKQIVLLILELIDLIFCPFLVLLFDNDIVCAVVLGVIFLIAIVLVILSLKDSRKRYKIECKKIEDLEEKLKQVMKFKNTVIGFKHDASDLEGKRNYLAVMLKIACSLGDPTFFYCRALDFNKDEIKEILYSFNPSKNLKAFIDETLLNRKLSNSIFTYESEVNGFIWDLAKVDVENSEDDDTFYDITRHYRVRIKPQKNKFSIEESYFSEWTDFWIDTQKTETYKTKEKAIQRCKSLVKEKDKKINAEEYFAVKDCDKKVLAFNGLWYLYEKGVLDDEHRLYCEYYSQIVRLGHLEFFKSRQIHEYAVCLKKFLPEKLLEQIYSAVFIRDEKKREDAFKLADKTFFENEEAVSAPLKEYAEKIFDSFDNFEKI